MFSGDEWLLLNLILPADLISICDRAESEIYFVYEQTIGWKNSQTWLLFTFQLDII